MTITETNKAVKELNEKNSELVQTMDLLGYTSIGHQGAYSIQGRTIFKETFTSREAKKIAVFTSENLENVKNDILNEIDSDITYFKEGKKEIVENAKKNLLSILEDKENPSNYFEYIGGGGKNITGYNIVKNEDKIPFIKNFFNVDGEDIHAPIKKVYRDSLLEGYSIFTKDGNFDKAFEFNFLELKNKTPLDKIIKDFDESEIKVHEVSLKEHYENEDKKSSKRRMR